MPDAYQHLEQTSASLTGIALKSFPHLLAFAQRLAARPAVQAMLAAEMRTGAV